MSRLFSSESLQAVLRRQVDLGVKRANGLVNLDSDGRGEAITEVARAIYIEPLAVDRSAPEYEIGEGPDPKVQVFIPFSGDITLWDALPDSRDANPPDAKVSLPRSASLSGGMPSYLPTRPTVPYLTLETTLKGSPTADDVKNWARREVETLERWIEYQHPQVSVHNADAESIAAKLVDKRLQGIADSSGLRQHLEADPGL